MSAENAVDFWEGVGEFRWAHAGGTLIKVVLTPMEVAKFMAYVRGVPDALGWVGSGGNVGYVSVPAGTQLAELSWPAVTLRGEAALWPGLKPRFELMQAVKNALDPHHRFPGMDE